MRGPQHGDFKGRGAEPWVTQETARKNIPENALKASSHSLSLHPAPWMAPRPGVPLGETWGSQVRQAQCVATSRRERTPWVCSWAPPGWLCKGPVTHRAHPGPRGQLCDLRRRVRLGCPRRAISEFLPRAHMGPTCPWAGPACISPVPCPGLGPLLTPVMTISPPASSFPAQEVGLVQGPEDVRASRAQDCSAAPREAEAAALCPREGWAGPGERPAPHAPACPGLLSCDTQCSDFQKHPAWWRVVGSQTCLLPVEGGAWEPRPLGHALYRLGTLKGPQTASPGLWHFSPSII